MGVKKRTFCINNIKRWVFIVLCITTIVVIFPIVQREVQSSKIKVQGSDTETFNQNSEVLNEDKPENKNLKPETRNPKLETLNLVKLDISILVDLKYATTNNFTGMVLYDDFDGAYLQPDVARMLSEAQYYLKTLHPELRLLVYDAVRPLSVQRIMWERVKDTKYNRYVASPDRLSLHNFGAAVDLTLADNSGQPLDMGTPFDHFDRTAGISDEEGLIRQGLLTRKQVQNRQLLRLVMHHAGFRSISGEWWHFNACSLQEAKKRYTLVE